MKLWHVAALLLVLGIGYVLIARPTIPPKSASAQAGVSNSIFGLLTAGINAASSVYGKATANSALPPGQTSIAPGSITKVDPTSSSDADYISRDDIGS